jgi:uncharacterized iron-regulated protein
MYRPLFTTARAHNVALVALNAPREVTRKIARGGLDGLSPAERATLPTLDLGSAAHRKFVRDAFGAHGATMKEAVFERFYTAQVVWDETMADRVAQWLVRNGPDARMVVVAGNGHVADRFGIPARAAKRTGRPYLTVVQEVVDPKDPPEDDLRTDVRYADFTAWWAPSAPPRPAKAPEAPKPPDAPGAAEAPKAPEPPAEPDAPK